MDLSSVPDFYHLYYQDLIDNITIPKYLASFEGKAAIDYLNGTNILWYNMGENGNLSGSIFLSNSNSIFLEAAKLGGIKLSGTGLSYEDLTDKWWLTIRNFELGAEDEFVFVYADDSIMWTIPMEEIIRIGENNNPQFMLLGNALSSGVVFDADEVLEIWSSKAYISVEFPDPPQDRPDISVDELTSIVMDLKNEVNRLKG